MLTCYIVDNESHAVQLLSNYVNQTDSLALKGSSENPLEALNFLADNPSDITFVDVDMPQLSGIDFSRHLHHKTRIVFTTAFSQYAVEAFDIDAADFLLKPFDYLRFLRSIDRVRTQMLVAENRSGHQQNDNFFYIKSCAKGKIVRVNFDDINYIKGALNYVIINVDGGEHLTYLTMKEIEDAVPSHLFRRVHKSFVVNEKKIECIENGNILLKNKSVIPIGASYMKKFFNELNNYILNSKRF